MPKLPIIKKAKMPSIKRPLSGSSANAWTEVKIPERTRNVPRRLVANANIDNKTDHFPNKPFV